MYWNVSIQSKRLQVQIAARQQEEFISHVGGFSFFQKDELAFRDDVRTLAATRDPEFEQIILNIKRIHELSQSHVEEQHLDLAA
jgi:hypothetical protein